MTDNAVHLLPNAGAPQTEPGRWPRRLSDIGLIAWAKYRGRVYCETWHRPARSDHDGGWVCRGCLATHRTVAGFVAPHEPSPPAFTDCWVCHQPLDAPSYTWAPHPDCRYDSPDGETIMGEGGEW